MALNSNGGDDDGARNGSGSGGETPTSSSANTLYKGWILTYQTSSPGGKSENINIADSSCKWQAKFACVSKQDKITLLYDYEANNETIAANLSAICGANCSASDSVTYRLDNGVKRELFVNYWKARLSRFEPSGYLVDRTPDEANHHHHYNPSLGMLNGAPFNYSGNHHLSNRDIGSSGGDQPPSSSSSQSGGGGFRFAGLFFKRGSADKSEKVKHSSLKRAKSGIQLERKKPSITSTGSSGAKESSSVTMTSNASQLDYDNRHSLPSPMRPSRSHESLSSPIASAIVTATTSTRHTPFISSQLDADSSPTGETPTTTTTTPLLSSRAIHAYYSTPYYYNSGNSNGSSSQQRMPPNNLLDQIVKIDLKRATASPVKSPASETSPATSSLSSSSSSFNGCIHAIHNSLLNEENCFEMRCPSTTINIVLSNTSSSSSGVAGGSTSVMEETRQSRRDASLSSSQETSATTPTNFVRYIPTSTSGQQPRYFMCRSSDERDKWLQCVRDVAAPNQVDERHEENSLQVWLLEAKGQAISSKPNRKYFCEVYLNTELGARTCTKEKREILFWGESFEFNNIQCEFLRVEFYQQAIETTKKKSKKENVATSSHTLLGYVNIPVSSIESSQPIEKWYKLETPNSSSSSHSDTTSNGSGVLTNSSVDLTSQQPNSMSSLSASQTTLAVNGSGNTTTSSLTTTQSFSKDSISIRIKAKYQSVDILPIVCYSRLIEFIRSKYLKLMVSLEPHLNVRTKDDLATSLIKISHKLHMQTEFLCDLVLAEVLALEDTSLTFRGNSLATKAMESYMKLVGENYLRLTLADCVRSIIDTNHDLEIDPSKVTNPSGLQANREELVQILHLVCGRVFNSCINFPLEMKHVFAKLRTECLRHGKTDEMCDTLISASIFLRFICPAILSPNLFNLTQEYPQEKAARKLTLAAKTLQTIANFSKFGGKEFYMSFDRMNRFVDEHTVLMREFLRNISTLSDEEQHELELEKTRWEKTASSTASGPISSFVLTPQHTPNSSAASVLPNNELNFDLEPIDLGKQLSILHSLLTSILSTLDEATQKKFDPELVEILREISEMKTSGFVSSLSTRSKSQQQNMTTSKQQQQQQQQHGNKLYSYENRLHQAVMMKSHHQQHQQTSPLTTITTPIEHTMQSLAQPSSSSSSSSRYSSQMALNQQQQQQVELNSSQDKLDVELQTLRNQLKETELSLKKEQTEKYLLEYKLKQQQQENDQQMRSIINRLIKVEEELRKEQSEMHKLLKAKQELIEIQKKRIEYLTNKTASGSTAAPKTGMSTSAATTTTNANGAGSNTSTTTNNGVASLVQTHPSLSYNQHSYQPKLKAKIVQLKPQTGPNHAMITSSMSNPNINQDVQTAANMVPIIVSKLADKSSHQIAASPSSSSSSMTQFCSYLAANSLNNNNTNNVTQNKLHSKSSAAAQNSAQQQQQQQNGSPSSSTSSSTSSTLSSSIQHSTGGASRSQSGFLRASEL